jgi:hypothetical protein
VPTPLALPHLKRIFEQRPRAFGIVRGLADETRALAVAVAAGMDHDEARELLANAARDKSALVRDAAVSKQPKFK